MDSSGEAEPCRWASEMTIPENILRQAITGVIDHDDVKRFCEKESLQVGDLWNQMALKIAVQFSGNKMSFRDADTAMNAIYTCMVNESTDTPFAEPAYSIFLAFDEGEYDHGDGMDPIERLTRPQLNELIKKAQQENSPYSENRGGPPQG